MRTKGVHGDTRVFRLYLITLLHGEVECVYYSYHGLVW